MNHIMLDLETFATSFTAGVVSVGACIFDRDKGIVPDYDDTDLTFHERVDLELTPLDQFGDVDPATVAWWLRQEDEARMSLVEGEKHTLDEVLEKFRRWTWRHFAGKAASYTTKTRLWSNGPTFDEVILRNAHARCGREFPIHHRASRCCRTIHDLATACGWKPPSVECTMKHDALADALWQANGVVGMYRHLRQHPVVD